MFVNGAHKCLRDTFIEAVQTTVKDNPGIGTEEAEDALMINWNIDTDQRSLIAIHPSLQYQKP